MSAPGQTTYSLPQKTPLPLRRKNNHRSHSTMQNTMLFKMSFFRSMLSVPRPLKKAGTILIWAFWGLATALSAQSKDDAPVFSTKNGAIDGYDPVAYFTEGKPVKGQATLTATWKGAAWRFASVQNRDQFQKNPEKYAPQYGGWCAYGWAQGYPAKIEPEAWEIVEGKLFLNYNLRVQKMWREKKQEYIVKANDNYGRKHQE